MSVLLTKKHMKYGVEITVAKDGSWCITQLDENLGKYINQGMSIFVDHSNPDASQKLLQAITEGLKGKIRKTKCI
jgi:hypothetical protein